MGRIVFKCNMPVQLDSITVENVVASADLGFEIDLESLGNDLDGVSYDPDQFPGLVYRTTNPKATALLFRSGKVVCTGAQSEDDVENALDTLYNELNNLGMDFDHPDFEVQNIVTSADLDATLNLNAIAIGLGLENVEYEPEQFPGLVYRLEEPDVVVLLFGSGKLVITGGKSPDDAPEALEKVYDQLNDLALLQ